MKWRAIICQARERRQYGAARVASTTIGHAGRLQCNASVHYDIAVRLEYDDGSAVEAISTGSECPSNSDVDVLRSSLFRIGKMGGGSRHGIPRTDHCPFRPDIRTSYNSRIRPPFDES